jgi:hypothetical protein
MSAMSLRTASRPAKSKPTASVWRVYRIQGARAVVISTLKALNADTAVKRVIEDHEITDPLEQQRLFGGDVTPSTGRLSLRYPG